MGPRVAFEIFGFPVYWYGIILTSAMLAATWVAARELKRRGHDPDIAWNAMITVLGLGIVGARLYHVFSSPGDGTNSGFDLELTRAVSDAVPVPVIASGGVGNLDHLADGIQTGGADAVLAASIFHYGEYTVQQAKQRMRERGIPVRL